MRAERGDRAASGARAEALAAAFLASKGLAIVARNVRSRFGEIDLVARDGDTLVFVEVRLRRSARFGGASGSITGAKLARIRAAAEGYLATLARIPACRVDAILLDGLDASRIEWLQDVAGG
jgi:putative endonuclease